MVSDFNSAVLLEPWLEIEFLYRGQSPLLEHDIDKHMHHLVGSSTKSLTKLIQSCMISLFSSQTYAPAQGFPNKSVIVYSSGRHSSMSLDDTKLK